MYKRNTAQALVMHLRKQGFRATDSRVTVIEVLLDVSKAVSADDIFERVRDKMDRTTVYRTLDVLRRAGVVARFTFENRHVYELSSVHSHYLICKGCKKVERLPQCALEGLERQTLNMSRQFSRVEHHELQLTGVCKTCS